MDSAYSRWEEQYIEAWIEYMKENTIVHIGDIEGYAYSNQLNLTASHKDNYNAFAIHYKKIIDELIN